MYIIFNLQCIILCFNTAPVVFVLFILVTVCITKVAVFLKDQGQITMLHAMTQASHWHHIHVRQLNMYYECHACFFNHFAG
jgi:hypothetical protein